MDVCFNGGKLFEFNGGIMSMKEILIYTKPEIEMIIIEEDVVRTSSTFGGNENELPVSPFT